ncbi:MAG: 50S ribosomal protein L25 [Candidatus Acetothermia bacterium]
MEQIQAEIRKEDEKTNQLRDEGMVPAVVYGPERESVALKINKREFTKLTKNITRSTRIKLTLGNEKGHKVFLRDIQYNHLTDEPIHVDFYEVPEDRIIEMEVPVKTLGESEGVQSGGIEDQLMETIKVEGPPDAIPTLIELDVEELEIGDSVHVADLDLDGVKILTPPDNTVVSILSPRKEIETLLTEEPTLEEELEEEVLEGEEAEEEIEEGEEVQEGEEESLKEE